LKAIAVSRIGISMARIIAGVGCSHVPAIGAALDLGKTEEPYWKRVFAGFEKSKQWIADIRPDVAIVVFNDHATSFSVEVIPTFALGCADHYKPADEGWGSSPGTYRAWASRTCISHCSIRDPR
jgi:protocatechuate 4,5-dioxygenase beta chain